jgi:hypothetical protein
MEGEPAAGTPPKALATTSTLPMWVQIVVALAGAIGALLVAVVGILKIFFPGTSEGTGGWTTSTSLTSCCDNPGYHFVQPCYRPPI